jgi:uroporphyrinogen decarboxylase
MVEGGSSDDYAKVKTLMYKEPKLMHHILGVTADAVTTYLNAQIEAGAQAVMVFDSWGGTLSHYAYHEFSLPYMKRIIEGLTREKDGARIPSIVFTKGGGLWIESIADTGCDAVGLDWTMDIGVARQRVGHKVALQGNMDPSVLFATPEAIRAETERILASYGYGSGHVFNLGHGISQFTNPDNAAALVQAVHELSRKYH